MAARRRMRGGCSGPPVPPDPRAPGKASPCKRTKWSREGRTLPDGAPRLVRWRLQKEGQIHALSEGALQRIEASSTGGALGSATVFFPQWLIERSRAGTSIHRGSDFA